MTVDVAPELAARLRAVADELGGRGLDLGAICRALLVEAVADLEARAAGDASLVTAARFPVDNHTAVPPRRAPAAAPHK